MNRKSGIELLRILCMFGIVYMHTFGSMLETVHGGNMALAVFENALFNCGVSCFVLISGYFGIKKNTRRLIKLDLTVIFFSLTATICTTVMGWDAISKTDWIKAIFPVITRRYWFMTCYVVLMLLAPYINQIPEKMEKKEFEKLLLLCVTVFSVIPSIFFIADNVTADSGKGLANMILMYLIGRYIRKYKEDAVPKRKAAILAYAGVAATFVLNMVLSLIRGTCTGNFARDCSVTILFSSIFIFLWFKSLKLQSGIINKLAQNVLACYVFEGTVRKFLNGYVTVEAYETVWYLFAVVAVYALVVLAICFVINTVRNCTVGKIEDMVLDRYFKIEK